MKQIERTDIEQMLAKELAKTKSILTFGTIGSKNLEKDVDIIVTKKPNVSSSDYYAELHNLFDSLNYNLRKNYGRKVICFSNFTHEAEIKKLAKYKKGDILLHTMSFVSLPQMKYDWARALRPTDSMESLLSKYQTIVGNKSDLFNGEFTIQREYDNLHHYMNGMDRFNSSIKDKHIVEVTNMLCHYISKNAHITPMYAKTVEEARNNFYCLADLLDKKNNE
jgi:hypothetical protein